MIQTLPLLVIFFKGLVDWFKKNPNVKVKRRILCTRLKRQPQVRLLILAWPSTPFSAARKINLSNRAALLDDIKEVLSIVCSHGHSVSRYLALSLNESQKELLGIIIDIYVNQISGC